MACDGGQGGSSGQFATDPRAGSGGRSTGGSTGSVATGGSSGVSALPTGGSAPVGTGGFHLATDASPEGATGKSFPCVNPIPIDQGGGFVLCDGNWMHRTTKEACTPRQPRTGVTCIYGDPGGCTKDSDCTARAGGRCEDNLNAPCACVYLCASDADCQDGEICDCLRGTCEPASCTTDQDCGGGLCSDYAVSGVCSYAFACQTPLDECAGWADCPGPCVLQGGHRICGPSCPPVPA
jgi:hypothetical protein